MLQLIKIFCTFAQVGLFTFGGGYSMLPMFQRLLVEKNGWLTESEMTDYFSISQCLPGVIAVNTSLFVGYKQKGRAGGLAAALGVIFPSIAIIIIIAALITRFADYPMVQHAFAGIRVCVCILIINTVVKLRKNAVIDKTSLLIFLCVFAISVFTDISVIILVVAAGIIGIGIKAIRRRGTK